MAHDPLHDLESLPDEQLFNVARNPGALHRMLAITILVERGSLYAGHPDIANDATDLVIENPIVLKKINPATAIHALKLPGVIDVLADLQSRRIALTRKVDENHASHTKEIADLNSTVTTNKDATDLALRQAYSVLWRSAATTIYNLKLEHDAAIAELRSDHEREIDSAKARLALLERSLWRKLVDWIQTRWSRLRKPKAAPVLIGQEDEAAFENRVAEMVRAA